MVEGLPSAREDEPEVSGRRCSDHVAVRNRSRSEDEEPLPGVEPSDVDTSTRPNKPPVWAPEAFTRQTWSKNWIVSPPSVSSQKGRFSSMEPPRLNSRSPTAVQEASHPRSGMSLLRASRAGHAGMPAPAMVGCRGGRGVARWPASEPGCARVHRLRFDTYRYLFPSEMEALGDRLETVRDAAKARRARTRYGPTDNDLSGTAGGMTRLRGGG